MKKALIIYLIILIVSISCQNNENYSTDSIKSNLGNDIQNPIPGRFFELNDTQISNAILGYTKDNHLESDKCYIILSLGGNTARKIISISNSDSMLDEYTRLSSFYTLIDGFVVFIYSDIDYLNEGINSNNLIFYRNLIRDNNIDLDSSASIKHPPKWYLINCLGDYQLHKSAKNMKYYELPCGYSLRREGVLKDSIWVEKD